MKFTQLFTLALISLVLVVGFASAESLIINQVTPLSYTNNATFTVTNNYSSDMTGITLSVAGSNGIPASVNPNTIASLAAGTTSNQHILAITNINNLRFGSNTFTVTATNGSVSTSKGFTIQRSFCRSGPAGTNLSIRDVEITNRDDSDDDEWKAFNNIEVEVEVSNDANDDLDDVVVELALFDSEGDNVINDVDFDSSDEEEQQINQIDENDEETVTFEFQIPGDFEEGSYTLGVKVYSDDTSEDRDCKDDTFSISVDRENDDDKLIVVGDIVLPDQAVCSEMVTGQFTVFNVGNSDQDDVRVNMFSTTLGINENFNLRDELEEGDEEEITFSFRVPANAQNMIHSVDFRTFYEDGESDETFEGELNVIGCSGSTDSDSGVVITTSPVSAQAGKALTIQSVVTNRGSTQQVLTLTATGYQSWASSAQVTPTIVTLAPGASQPVAIQMNVNEDASGSESFFLQMTADGQVELQPIEVPIQSAQSSSGFSLGGSTMIWIIAAVNIILILLIVVVAVKMSRR